MNNPVNKILKFNEFSLIYEAKLSISEPVGLAVLGAPAGGKSFMTKKISDIAGDARVTKAIAKGIDLTVDKLRGIFQSKKPVEQLKGFISTFYVMRDKADSEPEEYSKWYKDIKELWVGGEGEKSIKKEDSFASSLPSLKIEIIDDELLFDKKPASSFISNLGKTIDKTEAQNAINSLDPYNSYKRVVRYFQTAKQEEAIVKTKSVTYDEAGDEPGKIINNMKRLHNSGYVTDIILIHPDNVATNLIQNFYRVTVGNDGGRDSSAAIVQAFYDIEANKQKYINNAEKTVVVNSKDLTSDKDTNQKQVTKGELNRANIGDDEERGDKPIDVFIEAKPMDPSDAYETFTKNILKNTKREGLQSKDLEVFNALLKYSTYAIKDLPKEAKLVLQQLTKDMSTEEALEIIEDAAERGDNSFEYGGITAKFVEKAKLIMR
jgi:hypothetical protein